MIKLKDLLTEISKRDAFAELDRRVKEANKKHAPPRELANWLADTMGVGAANAILILDYLKQRGRLKAPLTKAELGEAKKRDYKKEYEKFQGTPKQRKYRAELNRYNRKKGTYGNGDGKDASHKGGKISGYEEQSKNRGRREKSRKPGRKKK